MCVQECIDEEEDLTDSCSVIGRQELEVDSGISRTDDSLRNDESSEHEMIDTDSASPSSTSAKYDTQSFTSKTIAIWTDHTTCCLLTSFLHTRSA